MAMRAKLLAAIALLFLPLSPALATCITGQTGSQAAIQSEIASCINSNGAKAITGNLEGQVLQDILLYLGGGGVVVGPGPAPTNSILPGISGTPQVGQTLTASLGTWANSPTGYSEQWLRGGAPILGATTTTYVPVTGDVGASLAVTIVASNAGGSTPATSASVGPVTAPAAPTNTTLPVISGSPQVGQTLTVSNGAWTGSPTGFTYLWSTGATGSSYVPVTGNIGATLTAIVTASNATGSTPATSAGVGPVTASGSPSLQAGISTLSNGTAGDAFGSNPTFIPLTAAAYETTVSDLVADELFGAL